MQITCQAEGCGKETKLVIVPAGGLYNRKSYTYRKKLCFKHENRHKYDHVKLGAVHDDSKGYSHIYLESGAYPYHRYVMEQKLGRKLVKGESVHHINGIRNDNRPENLELWLGAIRYGQRAADVECPHCGRKYIEK